MHQNPKLTVDGIILRGAKVLLVKRKNPPFQGCHALPGGFVEHGETVENAVVREVLEETGLKASVKRLVGVYSDPARDPRGHTVTIVFELTAIQGEPRGGDDATDACFFDIHKLPELAFDHSKIISEFLAAQKL